MNKMAIVFLYFAHFLLSITLLSASDFAKVDPCCTYLNKKTLDCSGCNLEHIPKISDTNITSLYLNDNNIREIFDFAFVNLTNLISLNVRRNQLLKLNDQSFKRLGKLETLDLTQDNHGYLIPPDTFKPLTSLKTLKLGNVCPSNPCKFPKEAFIHVSTRLEFLELSAPRYLEFGQEFTHLQNLKTLVLFGYKCYIQHVTRQTFAPVAESLKTLEIHDCDARNVDSNFLEDFNQLETLNFACNKKLKTPEVFEAVKNMPASTLKTLIVDNTHNKSFIELTPQLFNSTRFENLQRLSLQQTHIIFIDIRFIFYIPRLEAFNIGYNTILSGQHVNNATIKKLMECLKNSNITSIDISYIGESFSSEHNFRQRFCRDADVYAEDFFKKPPPQIQVPDPLPHYNHTIKIKYDDLLDWTIDNNVPQSLLYIYSPFLGFGKGSINDVEINSDNNILFVDFSGTRIKNVNEVINGFVNLQGLALSGCGIEFINEEVLDYFPSLVYLNLTENELADTKWDRLLKHSRHLKTLDISSNRLQYVPKIIFSGTFAIEEVLLSNNALGKVNINLENNDNLKLLDLRNTSITPIPLFLDQLDNLQARINHTLILRLEGNIFQCDCKNIEFLKWLKTTKVNLPNNDTFQCDYNKIRRYISAIDVDDLEFDCTEKMRLLTILLTPLASIVAVLLTIVLVHKYRWSIKWKFYLIRRKFHYRCLQRHNEPTLLLDEDTPYHAFVSYHHDNDYKWVQDTLLPRVEDVWGLKLCIGQRDFMPGIPIAENICKAIDNSRYVILMITPSFIASEWCDFEMHMALVKGRRHMIIIYKEEVDLARMSRPLRALMTSLNYIEYSEAPAANDLFWQRLRDGITSHIEINEPI